ncbi:transposable element Tcb2 transposase [Trichonephila clavipes]|nr:transposable element Tcb2 transposase [Trichonephila clavipes]
MAAQRYVHDILKPHVLPLMQRLPGAIFQQFDVRPHMARVSKDCLRTVTTLPWPARSSDLSRSEHIWDHLGRRIESRAKRDPHRRASSGAQLLHTLRHLYRHGALSLLKIRLLYVDSMTPFIPPKMLRGLSSDIAQKPMTLKTPAAGYHCCEPETSSVIRSVRNEPPHPKKV